MGFFKSVIHSIVPKEIRNVVNTVTKPVEGFLHNAIPKEIRPFVQEPVEFLIGGKDLGDLNIVPREIKRAIPKEIHGLSGPELAAIAAGSYFGPCRGYWHRNRNKRIREPPVAVRPRRLHVVRRQSSPAEFTKHNRPYPWSTHFRHRRVGREPSCIKRRSRRVWVRVIKLDPADTRPRSGS